MTQRLHATVSGKVQGVAFRWHTVQEAERLGLVGEVANRSDGRVQIVAEGNPLALRQLAAWAAEGSPAARVEEVDTRYQDATGEFRGFSVRR